jgi:hypothetical protein
VSCCRAEILLRSLAARRVWHGWHVGDVAWLSMHTPPRLTVRPSQVLRELQALRTELTLSQQSGHVHAVSLEALAAARQRHGGNTEEAAAAAAAAAPPPPPQQSAATAAAAAAAAASEEAHYLGLLDAIGLGTEPASAVLPPPLPLESEAHAPAATVSSMAGAPAADSQSLIVNLGDTPCPPPTPVEPWRTFNGCATHLCSSCTPGIRVSVMMIADIVRGVRSRSGAPWHRPPWKDPRLDGGTPGAAASPMGGRRGRHRALGEHSGPPAQLTSTTRCTDRNAPPN